jgi:hypothetical protein
MRGDPVFQSASDLVANAAEYWMPAFAGMTAENRSKGLTPRTRQNEKSPAEAGLFVIVNA